MKQVPGQAGHLRLTMSFPEGALVIETAYDEGDYSGAMLSAAKALEERSRTAHVRPLAIDWFELGYQITGPGVPYLGATTRSPALRSNPRFIKLLRDVKLDYLAGCAFCC